MEPHGGNGSRRAERFLVTGASGALGAWVVKTLLDQGVDVIALCPTSSDRRLRLIASADQLTRLERVDAERLEADRLPEVMGGVTHVVHTEGSASGSPQSGTTFDDVLGAASSAGVLGLSFETSMAVFGRGGGPVDKGDAPAPSGQVGRDDLARERAAERWFRSFGLASIGVRAGLVYGPGLDTGPAGEITRAIAAAIEHRPYRLDYTGLADLQYVGDVARVMCAAARVAQGHQMVNLRCGAVALSQFLRTLESLTGAVGLEEGDAPVPAPIAASSGDVDTPAVPAAGAHLDTRLGTRLDAGISSTIEVLRWAPRDLYQPSASVDAGVD